MIYHWGLHRLGNLCHRGAFAALFAYNKGLPLTVRSISSI